MAKADAEGIKSSISSRRRDRSHGALSCTDGMFDLEKPSLSRWSKLFAIGAPSQGFRGARTSRAWSSSAWAGGVVSPRDVLHAVASPLLPVPVLWSGATNAPHFVDETRHARARGVVFGWHRRDDRGGLGRGVGRGEDGGRHQWRRTRPVGRCVEGAPADRPGGGVAAAALGSMAVPLIGVLWRIGFLPGADLWLERAVEQLRYRRDKFVSAGAASEPASWRGGSAPASPSSTVVVRWGPWPPSAGRRRSTRAREKAGLLELPARAVPQRNLPAGPKVEGDRLPDEPGHAPP